MDCSDEAWEIMRATMDGVIEQPITDEEMERARTSYLRDIELAFNSSQGIALQLSEWAAMGDWRLLFIHRDRLRDLTTEEVNLDLERFQQLLDGLSDGWPEAIDIYQDDFLAGFSIPDANPFEEWATARRSAFRRRLLQTLEASAAEFSSAGRDSAGNNSYGTRTSRPSENESPSHTRALRRVASAMTGSVGTSNRLCNPLERELSRSVGRSTTPSRGSPARNTAR